MNSGLLKTKKDPRDYDYGRTFGISLEPLPDEYIISPLSIKNQGQTDFCTAAATCALAEAQDGVKFSFEWFFSRYGKPGVYGANLRTAMKAVLSGFIPADKAPFTISDKDRDFLADKNNWPYNLNIMASTYGKHRFFNVDGNFESIKRVLWANRNEKRAILTGVMWYDEWTYSKDGYVSPAYNIQAGLHAIAIIGFKGEYLIVQNSYGEDIGDNGLFYFSKEIFDREFSEPMFMYVDLATEGPIQTTGNFLQRLLFKLKNLC